MIDEKDRGDIRDVVHGDTLPAVEGTTADLRAERDSAKHEAVCARRDLEVIRQTVNGLAAVVGVEAHSGRAAPDVLREIADRILSIQKGSQQSLDSYRARVRALESDHEILSRRLSVQPVVSGDAIARRHEKALESSDAGKKNPESLVEDLEKARWYLDREIVRRKKT